MSVPAAEENNRESSESNPASPATLQAENHTAAEDEAAGSKIPNKSRRAQNHPSEERRCKVCIFCGLLLMFVHQGFHAEWPCEGSDHSPVGMLYHGI